jgi:secondary thiamine-phosphate synthase enzyme
MVTTSILNIQTKGFTDVIDVTEDCQQALSKSSFQSGILTVFNVGSTGSLTTIEFEPNLVQDLKEALEIFAPYDKSYHHDRTWGDDNGSSHIRATLMGPSVTVPFIDGSLTLGTWQQIIFCDFDTRPRARKLIVQIIGE